MLNGFKKMARSSPSIAGQEKQSRAESQRLLPWPTSPQLSRRLLKASGATLLGLIFLRELYRARALLHASHNALPWLVCAGSLILSGSSLLIWLLWSKRQH